MNPLLLFTLLCPDTAYFSTPFPVHIEQTEPVPPGYRLPNAWEARIASSGIVGSGRFLKPPDSLIAVIPGPGGDFLPGAQVYFAIGTFQDREGQIDPLPGVWCKTVMKERPVTRIRTRAASLPRGMARKFRLDGRIVR